MRTARVRTSGEYRAEVFVIAPPSQGLEPPVNPERFNYDQVPRCGLGIGIYQDPRQGDGYCQSPSQRGLNGNESGNTAMVKGFCHNLLGDQLHDAVAHTKAQDNDKKYCRGHIHRELQNRVTEESK